MLVLAIMIALAGCATKGVVDKPKMAEGYYMKGLSYLQDKNYELAFVEFQRAIQTDSSNKYPYYALGLINDMQGKLDDAAGFYEKAISRDADFSEAHNALGVVYFKQKKWKEAIKSFNKALDNKLYPTPHLPYLNLGDLYMVQGNYEKAIEAYQESKRFANLELTVYKLGMALFESGKIKEAVNEFREGVALSPKNANMRYGLALALLKDGNKKAAVSEFKRTVELAPDGDLAARAKDYIKTLR
jgi:Tfp pilus assembly protein PilF